MSYFEVLGLIFTFQFFVFENTRKRIKTPKANNAEIPNYVPVVLSRF